MHTHNLVQYYNLWAITNTKFKYTVFNLNNKNNDNIMNRNIIILY